MRKKSVQKNLGMLQEESHNFMTQKFSFMRKLVSIKTAKYCKTKARTLPREKS